MSEEELFQRTSFPFSLSLSLSLPFPLLFFDSVWLSTKSRQPAKKTPEEKAKKRRTLFFAPSPFYFFSLIFCEIPVKTCSFTSEYLDLQNILFMRTRIHCCQWSIQKDSFLPSFLVFLPTLLPSSSPFLSAFAGNVDRTWPLIQNK